MDHYSLESNLKFRRGASRYSHLFRAAIGHIISYCPWKSQIACFCLVLPVSSRSWCGHLAQVILVACHEASTSLRGCSWQLGFVWLCMALYFFFRSSGLHCRHCRHVLEVCVATLLCWPHADHMFNMQLVKQLCGRRLVSSLRGQNHLFPTLHLYRWMK